MTDVNNQILEQLQSEAAAEGAQGALPPAESPAPPADTSAEPSSTDAAPVADAAATAESTDPAADPNHPAHDAEDPAVTPDAVNPAGPDTPETAQDQAPTDYGDVQVNDLVAAAEHYPDQAFEFAVENMPDAAGAVLSAIALSDKPGQGLDRAFGLLLDRIDKASLSAADAAVSPLQERVQREQQVETGANAFHTAVQAVNDAEHLHETAAQVIEERAKRLPENPTHDDVVEFVRDCYDIARGRNGGSNTAPQKQETKQPAPVAGSTAAPASTSGGDAWEEMLQHRASLGV